MSSDAYQTVLQMARNLPMEEQLQLIKDVISGIRHRIQAEPLHDIMEFHGIAKDTWEGVDVEQYINDERNSWDR